MIKLFKIFKEFIKIQEEMGKFFLVIDRYGRWKYTTIKDGKELRLTTWEFAKAIVEDEPYYELNKGK